MPSSGLWALQLIYKEQTINGFHQSNYSCDSMSPDSQCRENGEKSPFLVLMHLTQHQADSGNTGQFSLAKSLTEDSSLQAVAGSLNSSVGRKKSKYKLNFYQEKWITRKRPCCAQSSIFSAFLHRQGWPRRKTSLPELTQIILGKCREDTGRERKLAGKRGAK